MQAFRLIVPLVIGFAGYRRAVWFKGRYGRTPWGWSPWLWGFLFFLGFIIGAILLVFAERSERKKSQHRNSWPHLGEYQAVSRHPT